MPVFIAESMNTLQKTEKCNNSRAKPVKVLLQSYTKFSKIANSSDENQAFRLDVHFRCKSRFLSQKA